ncbi:DUF2958 domain-containing protein [Candidatus Fermentibacterales bacterium]|nr:DUF2958 domain-containing protein [Candidatus Fermentibacterales bacterium]
MERLQNGTPLLSTKEYRALTTAWCFASFRDEDPVLFAKFFDPYATGWTWYATAYDEANGIFEGYVEGFEAEWGSWYASDMLKPIRMPGIGIERDLYFTPCRLSELGRF